MPEVQTLPQKEDHLDKFLEVLPTMYSNTPTSDESLRLLARKYGIRNLDQLPKSKDLEIVVAENPVTRWTTSLGEWPQRSGTVPERVSVPGLRSSKQSETLLRETVIGGHYLR